MSECKFAVEAFHAYIESIGLHGSCGTLGELKAFKAGAEWQRSQQSAPAGYVMVPVKPTPEMLDCIMDWQKIGNVTAYRAMLAAAPKTDVQDPARNPDVLALNAAREIMALVYGPTPTGGSPQLLAQIQCVVSEVIVYAAAPAQAAVPFAYHKKYMGGTDFMLHEPWCEDGISPEWEPLYAAPAQPNSAKGGE